MAVLPYFTYSLLWLSVSKETQNCFIFGQSNCDVIVTGIDVAAIFLFSVRTVPVAANVRGETVGKFSGP